MSSKTHKGKDFYIDNSLFAPIIGTTKTEGSRFYANAINGFEQRSARRFEKGRNDPAMFNVGVWCRCGSRFETPAQNGIAHFCEHMTFKGTTTRSELEINEQIADLGGKSNAWTDMDTTAFSIEVLNEDREAAIELLADILLNSTFTEANIDSERQVIFQEMYEDENDSDDCFNDAFSQLVYGSQPLGRRHSRQPGNARQNRQGRTGRLAAALLLQAKI